MSSSDTAPWPAATSFPSMPDGTKPKGRRKAQSMIAPLKAVGKMRPARGEIIIATGSERLDSRSSSGGGKPCGSCRDARRTAEREHYVARSAAGFCGRCGESAFDDASLPRFAHNPPCTA